MERPGCGIHGESADNPRIKKNRSITAGFQHSRFCKFLSTPPQATQLQNLTKSPSSLSRADVRYITDSTVASAVYCS